MLRGKYWIIGTEVVDVTTSEHAIYAKNFLLRLEGPERLKVQKMLVPLTEEEVAHHRARGIPDNALAYLRVKGNDPRNYVIDKLGWIRVRQNGLWLREWNPHVANQIRNANQYWSTQQRVEQDDAFDVFEFVSAYQRSTVVPVSALRPL